MPAFTHHLIPKDPEKDELNLARGGFSSLAIELVDDSGDSIRYKETSDFYGGKIKSVPKSKYMVVPQSKGHE
jgi:hypothetical protein